MPKLTEEQIADDSALRAVAKAHATRTIDGLWLPIFCPKSAAVTSLDQAMYKIYWVEAGGGCIKRGAANRKAALARKAIGC